MFVGEICFALVVGFGFVLFDYLVQLWFLRFTVCVFIIVLGLCRLFASVIECTVWLL